MKNRKILIKNNLKLFACFFFLFLFYIGRLFGVVEPNNEKSHDECSNPSQQMFMFVGEADVWWTNPQTANAIHVLQVNYPAGDLTPAQIVNDLTKQPSWLLFQCSKNRLYSANADEAGLLTAFSVDPHTRELTFINSEPSGGVVPVYLSMDPTNKFLLSASYNSGSISSVRLASDGSIGKISDQVITASEFPGELPGLDPGRQESGHPHMIAFDPQKKWVWVADLGLDRLIPYQFDSEQGHFNVDISRSIKLTHYDNEGNPVAVGPRHFAFDPAGRYMYVANELDNTVSVLAYDQGQIAEIQTLSTLPELLLPPDCAPPAASEIVVDKKGEFVYVSNRLDCTQQPEANAAYNSIAVFAINKKKGTLIKKSVQAAEVLYPRNFNIDSTGKYLYVGGEISNDIQVFEIAQDGSLSAAQISSIPVVAPSIIIFSGS